MNRYYTKIKDLWILFVMAIILLAGNACEEKDEALQPSTFSNLLTGGESKSWVRVSRQLVVETRNGNDTFNLDLGLPPCERDDLYTFYREGHLFEFSEGQTKCESEGEDVYARGTWEINNANAKFIFGQGQSFDLVKLTEDELVYGFETSVPLAGRPRPVPGFLLFTYAPD